MHSGAVFSLRVVAFDKRREDKTGPVMHCEQAVLVWGDGGKDKKERASERPLSQIEKELSGMLADSDTLKRNPSHQKHYTRNIRILVDGKPTEVIRKIHPLLIIEFNGQITTP